MNRSATFFGVVLSLGVSVGASVANATDILWANVSAVGKLTKGEGAASAERQAKGTYLVSFNGDVSKCNYGISLTNYGVAFTRPSVSDKSSVFIGIVDINGADFKDTSFYLQVICK